MYQEKGATVNILVPHDCENKCPFCNIKDLYKTEWNYNMNDILLSMAHLNTISRNSDFVITGGEPLAHMATLEQILNKTYILNKQGARHKLFIDTTLPIEKRNVYRLNDFKQVISGINVARHINGHIKESDDLLLAALRIPVRICSVLYTEEEALYAHEIIDRFEDIKSVKQIQFRDDYRFVDFENLYNPTTNKRLLNLLKGLDKSLDDCEFKYDEYKWECKITPKITFQRTMRQTKITYHNIIDVNGNPLNDITKINNIIIMPDGSILDDWGGQPLDLREYRKGLKNA